MSLIQTVSNSFWQKKQRNEDKGQFFACTYHVTGTKPGALTGITSPRSSPQRHQGQASTAPRCRCGSRRPVTGAGGPAPAPPGPPRPARPQPAFLPPPAPHSSTNPRLPLPSLLPSGRQERRRTPELPAESTPRPRGQDLPCKPGADALASRHQRALWVRDRGLQQLRGSSPVGSVPPEQARPMGAPQGGPLTPHAWAFVVTAAVSKSLSTRGARGPAAPADGVSLCPREPPYACA